jgi:hypothetical protein
MSLLLAAALAGAGVSDSADMCRADSWYPKLPTTDADYRPDFRFMGAGYIPPFADTPQAHYQTYVAAGIYLGASRGRPVSVTSEERMALIEPMRVRAQLCARGIRSAPRLARPDRDLSAT